MVLTANLLSDFSVVFDDDAEVADVSDLASMPSSEAASSNWDRSEESAAHIQICDGIIDMLSQLFNVSSKELRAPTRSSKPVARVRQIGMYVARVGLCMRVADIADGFCRDRSTVIYACHLIEDMRDDVEFDAIISKTEALICIAFRMHMPTRSISSPSNSTGR